MNFAFNHAYELHRFAEAVALAQAGGTDIGDTTVFAKDARSRRAHCAVDNADILAFLHVLRVELLVRYVMSDVVSCSPGSPFQYWLRFEWGVGGNPHTHGMS